MPTRFWIPRKKGVKKGALSHQLGIPEKENLPMRLLEDIKNAPIGAVIQNNCGAGKREIKITKLLKQRANLAITFKRMRKKRR